MAKSQATFSKKEREKKKRMKAMAKAEKREERKAQGTSDLNSMIAYVDEYGNFTSTPPNRDNVEEIKLEDIDI